MTINISDLELDLLLLCYLNADDMGNVDMLTVSQIAKQKLNVMLPVSEMKFEQAHLDILTERGLLPDVKKRLLQISKNFPKKPRRRTDSK